MDATELNGKDAVWYSRDKEGPWVPSLGKTAHEGFSNATPNLDQHSSFATTEMELALTTNETQKDTNSVIMELLRRALNEAHILNQTLRDAQGRNTELLEQRRSEQAKVEILLKKNDALQEALVNERAKNVAPFSQVVISGAPKDSGSPDSGEGSNGSISGDTLHSHP